MYVFVVGALLIAGLWLALERPLGPPKQALVRFGVLSYAAFAILSGIFWVCKPEATGRLVPGNASGTLVATLTQARGLIVVALGLICVIQRHARRGSSPSLLLSALLYNLLMFSEAFAAQFTPLATPERWLYVSCHLLWAITFTAHIHDAANGTFEARDEETAMDFLRVSSAFALLATALGLVVLAIPYDFQTPALPLVSSSYAAHAAHGLGSALVALGALSFATGRQRNRQSQNTGLTVLLLACFAVALLSLIQATSLGRLETAARALAFVFILCAGVLGLLCASRRTARTSP